MSHRTSYGILHKLRVIVEAHRCGNWRIGRIFMLIKINSPSYGCCHCVRCECRGRVYTSLHLVGEREVVTL